MSARDLFNLDGRVALVTGGSRGLGLQMATALGELGCRVAIVARKADELQQAEQHLRAKGIDAKSIVADLQKTDQIEALVDEVLASYSCVDILVNNAGATWGAPAAEYPDAAWHKVMNLNITAPFLLTREVGRRSMIPRRDGKIINIASIAGLRGGMGLNTIAYSASKAAMINFTRALAGEWGEYGINVNAICPGFFPSKMTAGVLDQSGSDALIARTPLKRLGGDEDLMGAVLYFASNASRHVTGQALAVDGGMSAV